jgi:dipeptidyl aminopeptidase/acylaminoacyl peptidase
MPWDETKLWVDGKVVREHASILQPKWSPSGKLYYISDQSGYWNIYCEDQPVYPLDAEFALPLWVLGVSSYGFSGDDLIASYQKEGTWKLVKGKEVLFAAAQIHSVSVKDNKVCFVAGFSKDTSKVVLLDLNTMKTTFYGKPLDIDPSCITEGQPIVIPGKHQIPAFYYPAKGNTKPPLLVKVHGGPTAQCFGSFSGVIQYWTSHGFAVLDVNYGGSSGYGRDYREMLRGQWGIVDKEDCETAALYLANQGLVDPDRMFIEGASSGGYTVLCCLTFGNVFAGGASYYGISDLSLLAQDTHKFESRYMDRLIGSQELYDARSPLKHAEQLDVPVIFFQGDADKVVPANQAQELYNVLKDKEIKTELVLYENEGHGFRKAETIQDALERELKFFTEKL